MNDEGYLVDISLKLLKVKLTITIGTFEINIFYSKKTNN